MSSEKTNEFNVTEKMSDSGLLYNLPLRVALPPLNESTDCNMNIMDMDKKLSKELNLSPDENSDVPKTMGNTATKDNKQGANEETDGSISMTSSEKQEWSVTLYDVDRKGNVSEEDLARLVTMLYKAAGSSITVPPQGNGSKKIKLRLSVAPEQNHTKVYIQKPSNNGKTNGESGSPPPTHPATAKSQNHNNPSPTENKKKERKHKDRSSSKYPLATSAAAKIASSFSHNAHDSGGVVTQDAVGKENIAGDNSRLVSRSHGHTKAYSHRKRSKKRHGRTQSADKAHPSRGSKKKEEEGGPVLENMDRRQYYKDLVGIENETLQTLELSEEKPSNNNNSHHRNLTAPASLLLNFGDESQGMMTLASSDLLKKCAEKSQTVFLPPPAKDKLFDNKSGNKLSKQVHFEGGHNGHVALDGGHNGYVNGGYTSGHSHHHHHGSKLSKSRSPHSRSRPKSCPIAGAEENDLGSHSYNHHVIKEQFIDGFNHLHKETESKTLNVYLTSSTTTPAKSLHHVNNINSPPPKVVRGDGVGETMSPHHMRRHRNREQEYNRSMKQVAEWIQRQHAWVGAGEAGEIPSNIDPPPVVLHHEHHHIHEHHHHYHFYHYYET